MSLTKVTYSMIDSAPVSVRDFGAVGDGVTNDTAAIQAALNSTATKVVFPQGTYLISNPTNSSDPVLTSAVDNRIICGPGVITALAQVKKALQITGDNTVVDGLRIDGNGFIGYAIEVVAENPTITGCYIHDLNGFDNWGGVAIRLNFNGLDTTALVSNNIIKNLQGVGDGTPGNGVGMQRAVQHETDQDCTKVILITGNNIEAVEGEEGDAIVIAGGTTADPKFVPAVVSNNTINGWTRRAVKIAANGVAVQNNYFTNDLSAPVATLQRVVDATIGSDLTISGNVFSRCKYQSQIAVFLNSPQTGDNYVIANNVIEGTGTTVSNALIALRTYGNKVIVKGNSILCPDHTTTAISVLETTDVFIQENTIDTNNITWSDFTNSTNVRLSDNLFDRDTDYQSYYDFDSDEFRIDVSSGRKITLQNRDAILSDGELAGKIALRQFESADPDTIAASLNFVAEGTTGNIAVAISAGSPALGTSDTERVRVKNTGQLRFIPLAADPSGAEAGDVYYNSGTNKLRCYDGTSWNDLF